MIYKDDLERVYALIEAPERWVKGAWAEDANGNSADPYGYEACRWCLGGAFRQTLQDCYSSSEMRDTLKLTVPVSHFNDSHTHAEVLALLKAAIKRAPVRPS